MNQISSAVPSSLSRYAIAGNQFAARLEAEARALDAVTGRFLARCTEERVPSVADLGGQLFMAARRSQELDGWVGQVADAFRRADASSRGAWDDVAFQLLVQVGFLEAGLSEAGSLAPLAAPLLLRTVGPGILANGGEVLARSVFASRQSFVETPLTQSDDLLNLIERSFWVQAFSGKVDPEILLALAARIDSLNLQLRGPVTAAGPYEALPPANSVYGAYRAISYAPNEQVVLERLNDQAYRLSIAGLDPTKPGAPNNFTAVIQTAYFPPEQNAYYRDVKARFLAALEQIPPGSELHLQGHSMGGGMSLLLRDDPEVSQRLLELDISVPSLTLYGTVVPQHISLDVPPPDSGPFAGTATRAYVHTSDSLARTVGAGYDDYAAVLLIDAGFTDAPATAHNGYGESQNYQGLPDSLQRLPYEIDESLYQRVPVGPQPIEAPSIEVPFA